MKIEIAVRQPVKVACLRYSGPPRGIELPETEQTTIAGGRYAVTHFKGTGGDYPRGASFDVKTGTFSCELCLPLGN